MQITSGMVKELRDKTGAGIMDCKEALTASEGSLDDAVDFLRKKGLQSAAKRSSRSTSEGIIESYIHTGNRLGVLLEVNCETEFVARTEDVQTFVRNLAMHIAASTPLYISKDDVPEEALEKERSILEEQAKQAGRPEQVIPKIVEGRLQKYYEEHCLLEQPFVKNPDITVDEMLKEQIAKVGENITVSRFTRFLLGESS
jgi:elongation factor Ts